MKKLRSLSGFRDFAPADCAVRNYLFSVWTRVARAYSFVEYEVPVIESTELYLKKSGGEIAGQLFRFEDQGGRDISVRPEVTPSLARLVAERQREYPKPLKWFQIGQCFRYERPQKGRTREFYQYNVDLIGESDMTADAEVIALAVDVMRAFGFLAGDFVVRLSSRKPWQVFCEQNGIENLEGFLAVIDKWEKLNDEKLSELLKPFELTKECVESYMSEADSLDVFEPVLADLEARGMSEFVTVDLAIVRGLAYYTGLVFEVFDLKHGMRAVAGGGRYDDLVATLSDGAVDLPTIGFGMGDVVVRNLIEETPHAMLQMEVALRQDPECEVYLVIADESLRANALKIATELRQNGVKVDFPLSALKMGKQFQKAEQMGARYALVVGSEFPTVQVKQLSNRAEEAWEYNESFSSKVVERLQDLDAGQLV